MRKMLIATTNPAKLEEIKFFLKDLPLKFVSLQELGINASFEETGKTFAENAQAKASFFSKKSGLPTLADDGGIEIDILNGEPGIKSRRWLDGKTDASDDELINHTLKRLKGVSGSRRRARFRAVLALAIPGDKIYLSEGIVEGIVAQKPISKRKEGYPYRSLFYLPQIKKYYLEDELSEEESKKYNHRGKALQKLKRIIKEKVIK